MNATMILPRPVGRERLAWTLLAGHVALIALSTVALTTFLAGPPPAWLAEPSSQRALAVGWRLSGPAYVVLGALATLAHATGRVGPLRALALLGATALVSLAAELIGTSTGYPFGAYAYTPLLGWRVAGLVPFPIPLSWFYMIYASLAIVARVLPASDDARTRVRWAIAAGVVLTAWDVAMDPAMVHTAHWVWRTPGFFYGMPLSNWFGWLLTGSVIAWLALGVVPPSRFAREVAPSRFPLALYAINGVFPIAICLRHGMWWAAGLGAIAMGGLVFIALRAADYGLRRRSPRSAVRSPQSAVEVL